MTYIIAKFIIYLAVLIKLSGWLRARHKSVLELAIGMLAAGEADNSSREELQDSHHFGCAR